MKKLIAISLVVVLALLSSATPVSAGVTEVKLLASDGAASDYFGWSVAISGDTAVVGAYNDDDKGSNSGSAYVFVRSGDTWTQQAKLLASDSAAYDYFGWSVAVSGDTAVVGAYMDDDKGNNSGSAYVFVRSGDTWTEQAKLTASDGAENDYFGISVAISGDTWLVGAFNDDSSKGSAYVYKEQQYTLTVSVSPSEAGSVSVEPAGPYNYGDTVTLTAEANPGYTFASWSGDLGGNDNPATITMDSDKTVAANFTQDQYTLTTDVAGSGSITRNPDNTTYTYGTAVQLTAVLATGWSFAGWSGDLGGNDNPETIVMDNDKAVTATFTQNQYTLTTNVVGPGSITKDPDEPTYIYGTEVELTALPDAGWSFESWSGDLGGNDNPETIVMDNDKAVTATFTQDQYTLTTSIVGSGSITKYPDEPSYTYGTVVTVTALPDAGWSFESWDDPSVTTNPANITMDGNKTVTATFTQDQYTLTTDVVGSGSITRNPDNTTYTHGTVVTVTALPDAGWSFESWDDPSVTTNPANITMDGNKAVTATFTQDQYTLTVSASPSGAGSVSVEPSGPYNYGDTVTLTAGANPGYTFTGWSGDLSGTSPATITMDNDKTVTATFTQDMYSLTATAGAGGLITPSETVIVNYGSSQTFTITPNTGYQIADVVVDGSSVGAVSSYTFNNVTSNHTIHASFTSVVFTAVIDINPDTLNLKSQSDKNAITAYIELPTGYDVGQIKVATVKLTVNEEDIAAQLKPTSVGDYDKDGIADLMVKFDRSPSDCRSRKNHWGY